MNFFKVTSILWLSFWASLFNVIHIFTLINHMYNAGDASPGSIFTVFLSIGVLIFTIVIFSVCQNHLCIMAKKEDGRI
jgi:hypothetical protein